MAEVGGPTRVIHSTCMMSHSGCGILIHVKDGKVVKVEGDPDNPMTKGSLCPKGLAALQFEYHPDRLLYPQKRIGARGEGKWQRITWDEALDTIASRLLHIRQEFGPEAVAVACGTGRPILPYARRFGNALGTPHHAGLTHICWRPQLGAAQVTLGRPIHYDLQGTKCLVVMGANWVYTNSGQCIFAREFMDSVREGVPVICIDPRLSPIAAQSRLWQKLRPGTDAALLLAWINVIIGERLYDEEFVGRWTTGFPELSEAVKDCTPEWAEGITWVPADQIRRAARLYATSKPACFTLGVAAEQSTNSFNTLRAAYILVAITGNVDVPGGNVFWENPLPGSRMKELIGRQMVSKEAESKMIGGLPLVDGSSPGYTIWQSIVSGKPYPIRAVLVHGANPLLTQEDPKNLVYRALKAVDFLVVSDMFMTPTAEFADILLPAATYLEKDDLNTRAQINRGYLSFAKKAMEPLGEARDDRWMFIEICRRMDLDYGFESVPALMDWMLQPLNITFDQLVERGPIVKPQSYRKHELGTLRPDKQPGFATPSGKVQLSAPHMAAIGLDPIPAYKEPPESPLSTPELFKDYPLVLTTGARLPVYFHTQYYQLPWLQEIAPEPRVEIHPDTAAKYGIRDGEWIYVENQRGRCRQRARLTRGIDRRVVHTDYAFWSPELPGEEPTLFDAWRPNPNLLLSADPPYDPAFGSTPMRSMLCRIYPTGEDSGSPADAAPASGPGKEGA